MNNDKNEWSVQNSINVDSKNSGWTDGQIIHHTMKEVDGKKETNKRIKEIKNLLLDLKSPRWSLTQHKPSFFF